MRYVWLALVVGVVLGLARPAAVDAQQPAGSAGTAFALGMALNRGDVDGAVALFAEDGRVRAATQGGQDFVGRQAIREWATRLVAGHFRVEYARDYVVNAGHVSWPTKIWLDQYRNLGVLPVGIVIEADITDGGLIRSWSSTITAESQERLAAATAAVGLVDRLFEALNAGNIDATVALLSDDVSIVGALGDRIQGIAEARAYYERLIGGQLKLTPAMGWILSGDRVTGVYGLSVASLRALGIESAETIGDFYIRDGKIAGIVARFTPNTAAAVRAAMP